MITISTLPQLLDSLGYTHEGSLYTKYFSTHRATISVDLSKKLIQYPTDRGIIVNGDFTCNFSSPENFVVLECVTRLLSKGYHPEHIELEPKWQVGHGASGGRADILVRDNSGASFLIIECKTAGGEFSKYWNKTLQDGDQLLSYAQNDRSQYLCMYASDYDETMQSAIYQSHIISLRDNEAYIQDRNAGAKTESDRALSYAEATNKIGLYRVWRDTYLLDFSTSGIFEEEAGIYDQIGKKHFSIHDLIPVGEGDIKGKQHEFATIMRKRNIGSREGAFNALINLILCKVVDEKQNPNNLQAVWKGITSDNHFALQDRLQRLYQQGMKAFLGEDITYIEDTQVDQAFSELRRRTVIRDVVKEMFKQLKYFKTNDFAFIEVHNEKLFYQNAAVLLDVVRMLQNIRLTGQEKNQFLGDMFEFFLDQGVKQSEGQFFTPMPIVRCIIASLPLQSLLGAREIPLALDYACGAGHFLTELASQMGEYITDPIEMDRVEKGIYGIEKEYRLSKVSKVSAFMYGQDGINIIHHDALASHDSIRAGTFSVIVANPPYSVKGFLSTLSEVDRARYTLTKTINDVETSNSIETFFLERAAELLAPGGVASIIFPSSILSNSDTTYIRAREILLSAFEIVAVMELGSGTFGKTGTNTVTLFLRRRPSTPPLDRHYQALVADWWDGVDTSGEEFGDHELLSSYVTHRGLDIDDYRALFRGEITPTISTHEGFMEYQRSYLDSTEWKQYTAKSIYKSLSPERQEQEKQSRLLRYIRWIESEKLVTYLLTHSQSRPVLIVKSPSDTKGMKEFLGYEWSTAKGSEGIRLFTDSHGRHETPLYDPASRLAPGRINTLIEAAYRGEDLPISSALSPYVVRSRLVDMLDYDRREFTKVINLSPKQGVEIVSKYEIVKLGNIKSLLKRGKSTKYGESDIQVIKSGQARGGKEFDFSEKYFAEKGFQEDERRLEKGDILINSTGVGTAGRVTYFEREGKFVTDSHITILRVNREKATSQYVHNYLSYGIGYKKIESLAQGTSGQIELSLDIIENIRIPLPPLDIQSQIVAECEAIDHRVETARRVIDESRWEVEEKVGEIFQEYQKEKVINLQKLLKRGKSTKYGTSDIQIIKSGQARGYMSFDFTEKYFVTDDFKLDERILEKGDLLINSTGVGTAGRVTLFFRDGKFVVDSHITIFRPNEKILPKFALYSFAHIGFKNIEKIAKGLSGQIELTLDIIGQIQIPLPPLPTQLTLVSEIEAIEARIAEAEAVIQGASRAREEVMGRWL